MYIWAAILPSIKIKMATLVIMHVTIFLFGVNSNIYQKIQQLRKKSIHNILYFEVVCKNISGLIVGQF